MNQQRPSSENFTQFKNGPTIFSDVGEGGFGAGVQTIGTSIPGGQPQHPPPLPPRISRSIRSYQPYNNMGYNTGGYAPGNNWNYRGLGGLGGGYGNYGTYGGYSHSYLGGMQAAGYPSQLGGPSGDVEDRFVQFAEESSRRTFQSIESIVQTFSSVAMMLESTLFAMTSSFRAILSVAENVGRVRNLFGEILSTFALVRLLKWLYRKTTYMLGLNPDDPSTEQIWRKMAVDAMNGDTTGPSAWPIIMFVSLIIAIPYMINKFMNKSRQKKINGDDPKKWFLYNEPVYSAIVLYNFEAATADELTVKSGQKIWLAPQSLQQKDLPGWSRVTDDRQRIGLVPTNYMRIVGQLEKKSESNKDTNDAQITMESAMSNEESKLFNDTREESRWKVFDEESNDIVP